MKMNSLKLIVAICLAGLFAVSSFITYNLCSKNIQYEFRVATARYDSDTDETIRSQIKMKSEDKIFNDDLQHLVNDLSSIGVEYPTVVAMFTYEDNPKLIAINQSHLKCEEFEKVLPYGELNLEPYLTDEMKRDLSKLIKNANSQWIIVKEFTYREEKDNIIPVDMYLEVHYDHFVRKLNLNLSHETPNRSLTDAMEAELYFSDIYGDNVNARLAAKLREEMLNSTPDEIEKSIEAGTKDSGGCFTSGEEIETHHIVTRTLQKDERCYYFAYVIQQNVFYETITSLNFRSHMLILICTFIIIGMLLYVSINKNHHRGAINE